MSTGTGVTAPRICRREGCGRPCPVRVGCGHPRVFCCQGCHDEHWRTKNKAKRVEEKAKAPAPERASIACALAECGERFVPKQPGQVFHTWQCKRRHYNRSRTRGAEGRTADEAARESASARALLRVCFDVCPGCQSPLSCDLSLVYCVRRCGWMDLLTAKVRDPRAGTPDPVEETDEP